ncbi:hypothetical protein K435DRAFT_817423 [Dendrothele bispora CBS 962.96]|uniref:BTB domain-containing protein n=1 Tax=Dendrothele bispora (strain CBS 962.96) TaxID=1314807 RepID=A0A4S8MKG9_DENBC|nr:hypothetical protein K435DRAFT_817423 [Dendrothele bispora CBS 962.96]
MTMPSASSSKSSTPTAGEEEEESSGSSSSRRATTSIIRDEDYYFEDGSCILLVQDTLFNVHRSMLSRDHSSFGAMFSLPQGGLEAEGKSDDNPIVLPGDKASEFRHFLWALYALPHELRIINSPGADLTLLIDIARISNKYSFKSLETWALDAVHEYVNRKPSPLFFTSIDTYSSSSSSLTDRSSTSTSTSSSSSSSSSTLSIESTESLTRLIQLAQLCNHERLLNTMINLLRQLMSKSLQYAYLAMKLADDLDIRALRGSAYLEVMQKSVVVRKPSPSASSTSTTTTTMEEAEGSSKDSEREVTLKEGSIDPQGRLVISPSQRLRLLSGYWNLTRQWEKLRTHPPVFAHSSSCGASWHHHGCTQSWVEFWKEKTKGEGVLEMGLADVLGRLRKVQKDYEKWGSATYMHHDCRLAARRCIGELVRGVEEKLPDYFGDEEGEEDYGVM